MLRDRAFTLIAVLILRLGIGANVAASSASTPSCFGPCLSKIRTATGVDSGSAKELRSFVRYVFGGRISGVSTANHSLEKVTVYMPFYGPSDYKLTGGGEPQPVSGVMVACNFFQTLGVRPALGLLFTPDECHKNGPARCC